jgi:hypothetical protein
LKELSKKTNSDVMVGVKVNCEEYDSFDDVPDEDIVWSGNEMRLVLDLKHEVGTAMIPDFGYEGVLGSVTPNTGTLTPVQMNKRYAFSTLAKQYGKAGRAGFIKSQITHQANKAIQAIAETIGLQAYGFSTGTIWKVQTTGSSGTVHTSIAIKDAFGSTLIAGGTTAQDEYQTSLLRPGEGVAFIRSGSILEFGVVVASPGAAGTAGTVDITTNGTITPTADDIILKANAVTGATLSETDQNRWPLGWLDVLTSASVHGLAASTAADWAAGFADTSGSRMDWARHEKMANALQNLGGVKLNRVVYAQGVRRDIIAGEAGAKRYDSGQFDWDNDFGKKGIRFFTSRLVPPGFYIGYNNEVYRKKAMSDKPAMQGGPDIFSLDKIEGRGGFAASFDFVYLRAVNNRRGMGYASGLNEQ